MPSQKKPKTTWTSHDGKMTFFLTNRTSHDVPAQLVDHPITICRVLDDACTLSSYERRALLLMLANFELVSSHPRKG